MATSERVTVTLPKDLVAEMDKFESNRSRFVATAVRREVMERHRELLRESLESIGDEALELAEVGFEEWAATTGPDDHLLVNPEEGEPVAWVPGQGWMRRTL